MNKFESILGALALTTSLTACGTPEFDTTRVMIHNVGRKISALTTGKCHSEQLEGNHDGTETQKITCEGSSTEAHFTAAPVSNNGVSYQYRYGIDPNNPNASNPSFSVTVMPDGSCQTVAANNIRTRRSPETINSLWCNTDGECFKEQIVPEHFQERLSPEDANDLCQVTKTLAESLQRALD